MTSQSIGVATMANKKALCDTHGLRPSIRNMLKVAMIAMTFEVGTYIDVMCINLIVLEYPL